MLKRLGWITAAAAIVLLPAPTRARDDGVERAVQALLDSLLAAHPDIPGIAVHIESPKLHLSYTGVAGYADRRSSTKLTASHPARMASNTKTYVAATILRLWEDGKLGLDDPISKHLPAEYLEPLRDDGYLIDRITIRQVLSHTGGIYDWATDTAYANRVTADPKHRWSRLEQVRFAMDHGAPYGAPGEVYHYSDTGYILLGEIIERLTGMPYGPAMRQLLGYRKLGLNSTWLESLEPVPAGVPARAHQFQREVDTYEFDPSLDLWGGGGLAATTRDMAVFTRSLFTGAVYRKPTTIDTMLTRLVAKNLSAYRFGIGEGRIDGYRSFGHSGYWNTFSYYLPELDLAVAGSILQNGRYDVSQPLAREVVLRVVPARGVLLRRLDAALKSALASDTTVPGAAIHLESPKLALSWSGAGGLADVAKHQSLRADQPVRIASNTKTYTAAAILRLIEQGKLGVDDPIAKHLPADLSGVLTRGGYDPNTITIRHLLQHTSGLYDYAMDSTFMTTALSSPARRWTRLEQVTWAMEHGKALGKPGQIYHYSDTGYVLLGAIVERLSGLSLGAAFRSLLRYEPNGLYATWLETIDPDPWMAGDRAHQYFGAVDTYNFDPSFDLYGGGGLVAPVRDLALFTRALLVGKVYQKPATLELMLTAPGIETQRDYRMGIYRHEVDGIEGFGHSGFWGTTSFYFPRLDLAVAISITQQGRGKPLFGLLDDAVRLVAKSGSAAGQ